MDGLSAGNYRKAGQQMMLFARQSYELLAKHGVFVKECCDRCGQILGPVRFTRQGDAGVWCSRECRGDGERQKIHKGGRPSKYKDERTRKKAHAQQQRNFRLRSSVTKTCQQSNESKGLTGAKLPLSHYPPYPAFSALETGCSESGGVSA
jgi:hypothetical protein